MPDIAVGQIVQTRHEYLCFGQTDLNVMHWRVKAAAAGTEMFSFLSADFLSNLDAIGGLNDGIMDKMSNEITLRAVHAQVIAPTRYRSVRRANPKQGSELAELPTNNIALSVTCSPEQAGRGRTGRIQLPGLPAKWMSDGLWDIGVQNHYTNLFNTWRTLDYLVPGTGVTLEPVLYNPTTSFFNKIVVARSQDTVRVMRRRTVGVGQ